MHNVAFLEFLQAHPYSTAPCCNRGAEMETLMPPLDGGASIPEPKLEQGRRRRQRREEGAGKPEAGKEAAPVIGAPAGWRCIWEVTTPDAVDLRPPWPPPARHWH